MKTYAEIVESLLCESKSCDLQADQSAIETVRRHISDVNISNKNENRRNKDVKTKGHDAKHVGVIVGERSGLMQKLRLDEQIAAVSRNRAIFNRNMETLPDIGCKASEVSFYVEQMPKTEEIEGLNSNPVIDVINRNEAKVMATARVREISHNFIKSAETLLKAHHYNNAPEIIEKTQRNKKSSFSLIDKPNTSYDIHSGPF